MREHQQQQYGSRDNSNALLTHQLKVGDAERDGQEYS
jgi:hypothetical protein